MRGRANGRAGRGAASGAPVPLRGAAEPLSASQRRPSARWRPCPARIGSAARTGTRQATRGRTAEGAAAASTARASLGLGPPLRPAPAPAGRRQRSGRRGSLGGGGLKKAPLLPSAGTVGRWANGGSGGGTAQTLPGPDGRGGRRLGSPPPRLGWRPVSLPGEAPGKVPASKEAEIGALAWRCRKDGFKSGQRPLSSCISIGVNCSALKPIYD